MLTKLIQAFLMAIVLVASSSEGDPAHAQQNDFTCETVTQVPPAECEALVALYRATDGAHWHDKSGWLITDTPCSWHGITCDVRGRVIKIELRGNTLSGNAPPELGGLAALQELDLGGIIVTGRGRSSGLTGSIPPELGQLTDLVRLDLSYNKLTGTIPAELGNLVKLQTLSLSYNQLSGCAAPELDRLPNLKVLHLQANPDLSRCTRFSCDDVTEIPRQECTALVSLHKNMHNPTHWDWLLTNKPCSWLGVTCDAGHVKTIDFSDTHHYPVVLFGRLPPELGGLDHLESLRLGGNQLTGSIPPQLAGLTNLRHLHLGYNNLSGSIPSEIGDLDRLETLNLSNNDLGGSIPASLGNLYRLKVLELSVNRLSGRIPPELGHLDRLEHLNLSSNQLSGRIPPELYDMPNLEMVYLFPNEQLTGEPPQGRHAPETSRAFPLWPIWLLSGLLFVGALFVLFYRIKRQEHKRS